MRVPQTVDPSFQDESSSRAQLPRLSECVSNLLEAFEGRGILGLLLLDSPGFEDIERREGHAEAQRVHQALGQLVVDLKRENGEHSDLVVTGEVGRTEILIFWVRHAGSADFYRRQIPDLARLIDQSVMRCERWPRLEGSAVQSDLRWGRAVGFRNPGSSTETQLREIIETARQDAESSVQQKKREHRRLFTELLLDRRVTSVYEPIVDVQTRTVFGYEALARGPRGTPFHSAGALFSAAETHDLVFELDSVCRASGLKGAVELPAETKLFLNVRPSSMEAIRTKEDGLVEKLHDAGLNPTDVVLEINEQESIDDFSKFRDLTEAYRKRGFEFALDDTGSGYSSFEQMIELSPEYVKIDRSMVTGVDQDSTKQNVLAALLTLAEQMGSRVIGEGLGRLEELETLQKLGIHFGQGWLFGQPTPMSARSIPPLGGPSEGPR